MTEAEVIAWHRVVPPREARDDDREPIGLQEPPDLRGREPWLRDVLERVVAEDDVEGLRRDLRARADVSSDHALAGRPGLEVQHVELERPGVSVIEAGA